MDSTIIGGAKRLEMKIHYATTTQGVSKVLKEIFASEVGKCYIQRA